MNHPFKLQGMLNNGSLTFFHNLDEQSSLCLPHMLAACKKKKVLRQRLQWSRPSPSLPSEQPRKDALVQADWPGGGEWWISCIARNKDLFQTL